MFTTVTSHKENPYNHKIMNDIQQVMNLWSQMNLNLM